MSQAEIDVLAERQRQIYAEGFDEAHDDQQITEGLAVAAACYALPKTERFLLTNFGVPLEKMLWPWDSKWWKPKDRRRDLIRAAALIIAEIDRLDREANHE